MLSETLNSAKLLLKKYNYSIQNMSPETLKLYDSYQITDVEEHELIFQYLESQMDLWKETFNEEVIILILDCIKEYLLYDYIDNILILFEEKYFSLNPKYTIMGKLNAMEFLFKFYISFDLDKEKMCNLKEYLETKLKLLKEEVYKMDDSLLEDDITNFLSKSSVETFILHRIKIIHHTINNDLFPIIE